MSFNLPNTLEIAFFTSSSAAITPERSLIESSVDAFLLGIKIVLSFSNNTLSLSLFLIDPAISS